jgi:hypothetical protein
MAAPSLAGAPERASVASSSLPTRAAEFLVRYGPALIILTLPLEFTARYMRQPAVRYAMVLVAAALAYLILTRRRAWALPREASAIWLTVFVIAALVSWLPIQAPGSLRQVADVALYPLFGLVIMNLVLTRDDHQRAWVAFLVSGLAVAVLGFALYATHHTIWTPNPVVANRLNITFADPNITARFLTLSAVVAVMLFANRRGPVWLCAASAAACAVVVPMTYSRSGLALFVASLLIAAAVVADRRRAFAFAGCILVVFVLSTAINPVTRQRALDAEATLVGAVTGTAANLSTPDTSPSGGDTFALADNRRYLIEAGVKMFADHPLTGVGFGDFQHAMSSTYKRFIPSDLPNPDFASHTAFVTIAAEQGVIGILLILIFLVQLAREALATRFSTWSVLPAILIVPLILYSQFEGRFIEEPYLWLCLGLFYAAARTRDLPRMSSHTM